MVDSTYAVIFSKLTINSVRGKAHGDVLAVQSMHRWKLLSLLQSDFCITTNTDWIIYILPPTLQDYISIFYIVLL